MLKRYLSLLLSILLILSIASYATAITSVAVKGITLDKTTLSLNVGQSYTLKVSLNPSNTTQKALIFATANKNIASIDKNGKITGVAGGTTKITVISSANSKVLADCTVTVASAGTYPIKTNVKLKYWVELNAYLAPTVTNFGNSPLGKELEKRTGVKVEWIHPAQGQTKEVFNILIASGDLPDIIQYDWANFPGGATKALNDGYIIKLNDTIDKNAPNLKKYLSDNQDINKMVKTDAGAYYAFPMIKPDPTMLTYRGPVFRKDWLDDLGLQVPVTMDDWYSVLKAFKEKKAAPAPLTMIGSNINTPANDFKMGFFCGAYGTFDGFYLDNSGKVRFGPTDAAFKDFLTIMHKWYAEGLLDKNFATNDLKAVDANVLGGKSGAVPGNAGGGIGKWMPPGKAADPKFDLVGAPYPVLNKGDKPEFGQWDFPYITSYAAAITTNCKNVDLAAKYLDYGYGEEGHMLFNFGIEGQSYTMVNGYPQYTDLIINNPGKLPMTQALSMYAQSSYAGTFVMDARFLEQYFALPEQKAAVKVWPTNMSKHHIPIITPTSDESTKIAQIMNDVNAYVDEMTLKFIMGAESLDKFDDFVKQVNKLGIVNATSITQAAVDRYNKR